MSISIKKDKDNSLLNSLNTKNIIIAQILTKFCVIYKKVAGARGNKS